MSQTTPLNHFKIRIYQTELHHGECIDIDCAAIYIDQHHLSQLIDQVDSDHPSGLFRGFMDMQVNDLYQELSIEGKYNQMDAYAYVMVCGCFQMGCDNLSVKMTIDNERVIWSHWFKPREQLVQKTFIFDKTQYLKEVDKLRLFLYKQKLRQLRKQRLPYIRPAQPDFKRIIL